MTITEKESLPYRRGKADILTAWGSLTLRAMRGNSNER